MTIEEIKLELIDKMDTKRYEHTIGVMYTAAALAMNYGTSVENAMYAGLLHDCVKCYPKEKMLALCEVYNIELTPIEKNNFKLIHAKLGAVVAKEVYGIKNNEICSAVNYHTTGRPNMTLLEKIVFIADYIEPNRGYNNLIRLRELSFKNIDLAVYESAKDTLNKLEKQGIPVDTLTRDTYEFYKPKEKKLCQL